MDAFELGPRRGASRQVGTGGAIEADRVEAGEDGIEQGRTFRVSSARIVLGEQRIGRDEQHGQRVPGT